MEGKMEARLTMKEVWIVADAIVSPLGQSSDENFQHLVNGVSGVEPVTDLSLNSSGIPAGVIETVKHSDSITRFERICLQAMEAIMSRFSPPPDKTIFILSTTKGNISLLDKAQPEHARIHLHATADFLMKKSGFKKNLVISNACISGVMALIVAKRFLQAGNFDHALVVGADELSRFVISGFQSLQALSSERCRPFDAERRGINLGEAAAAMLISTKPSNFGAEAKIRIMGSGLSNDANHISGPSRTGAELCSAIQTALSGSDLEADAVDFISAHGTATLYNDEMEAKAFTLAGFSRTPVNSLKAYYGHTLGAAGVLETIVGVHSLLNNVMIPTLGFENSGVSEHLNILRKVERKPLKTFLKTASGFGGCNAAIMLQKIN